MDLKQLAELIFRKELEFENAIRDEAKKICLDDITSKLTLDTMRTNYEDFEDGQALNFHLFQGNYNILINRQELIIIGPYHIKLKEFKGNQVATFYDTIAAAVLKKKEEYLENLPF